MGENQGKPRKAPNWESLRNERMRGGGQKQAATTQ